MTTPLQVADGVFLVSAGHTNWILLEEDGALTLVDSGYPAHREAVEDSVASIGRRPEDIRAMLITHAHVDHIGSASALAQQYSFPVFASPEEVPHARREYLQQAGPLQVAANAWRPGVLPWSLHIVRVGALKPVSVPEVQAFPSGGGALDVPGHPIPVPLPGHTSGHTGYLLPGAGAVVSGDALVTAHATSRVDGPQFLLPMFHHDEPQTHETVEALADLPADILLPGHGPAYRGSLRTAVDTARERVGRASA